MESAQYFYLGERIFEKSCGFVCRIHRIRVDGSRYRKEKVAVGIQKYPTRVDGALIKA